MKSRAPLWRISVVTTAEAEDAVSELLASVSGLPAASYHDNATQTTQVSVFAEHGTFSPTRARKAIEAGLDRIRSCGLDTGRESIEVARIKREDWAESWKRHFKPIEIRVGTRHTAGRAGAAPLSLLVKPSWSRRRAAKNQRVVILDPGLSFGTGQHPTTAFCLHEIVRYRKPGARQAFLDIGTGSGILAIAAAKLGYGPVHGFDNDPEAVRVARENAGANRVVERVKLSCGDIARLSPRPDRQYDLICANLISDLLIRQRWRIVNRLKPDGALVVAGILSAEFAQVERAFADLKLKLKPGSGPTDREWRSGVFCFV